jgi:hypothetical protein
MSELKAAYDRIEELLVLIGEMRESHQSEIKHLKAKAKASIEMWRSNSSETWSAMTAMRNDINEVVPLPSLESDLLNGPLNSVFCYEVAFAVVERINAHQSRITDLEALNGWYADQVGIYFELGSAETAAIVALKGQPST